MAFVPENAFGNLPEERREVFWEITGAEYIPTRDLGEVQERWAVGYGYQATEYDQMGITKFTVTEQREWFLDYMGLEWDQFPWSDWREAMGYE